MDPTGSLFGSPAEEDSSAGSQNGWLPGRERAAGQSHFRSSGHRRACELLCEPRGGTRTHTVSFAPSAEEKTRGENWRSPRSAQQARTPGSGWSTNNTTTTSGTTNSDTSTNHEHHQHEPRHQLRHFPSRSIVPTIIPSFSRGEEPPYTTRSPSLDSFWMVSSLCDWPKGAPSPLIGPGGVVTSGGPPLTQWRSPIG